MCAMISMAKIPMGAISYGESCEKWGISDYGVLYSVLCILDEYWVSLFFILFSLMNT